MLDNARRGAEVVGGQGAAARGFTFATLYRTGKWADGQLAPAPGPGRQISLAENPATLFT